MKLIKIAGISVVSVVVLFFGIAIYLPSQVHIKRSITIPASQEIVFEQVNDLRTWRYWSPWQQADPNMEITYVGFLSGKNASYRWKSKRIENGQLTITKSDPYNSIATRMQFGQREVIGNYRFVSNGDRTILTWIYTTDVGENPIAKYMGILMDPLVGPELQQGLVNLKNYINSLDTTLMTQQRANND